MLIVWFALAVILLSFSVYAFKMYRGEKEKKKLIVRPRMMSLRRRHSHGHG
ncbi:MULTISPECIES: hypothetical protein [Yersiniaceae]|uniref:High mobility group protein Z n=1 Tax=Nissabacter archeti TaxID=1917880 RepID=A0ABS5JCE7_9GAMM|nr:MULTISPECIES: hypothetical protein [Yersiniaceae]MBS0967633.1 hypothetical protein [Nissabacter archeti]MDV5140904.1 hypothetical protein [Chimaeribacter arupi]WKZ93664.1 hypothetical protein P0E69_07180 [Chimaeribacter arupi]